MMDIWNTKKGDLVRFTRPTAGHQWDGRLAAQAGLKQGEIYTVEALHLGEWQTNVELCLDEHAYGILFSRRVLLNAVMFDNVERAV